MKLWKPNLPSIVLLSVISILLITIGILAEKSKQREFSSRVDIVDILLEEARQLAIEANKEVFPRLASAKETAKEIELDISGDVMEINLIYYLNHLDLLVIDKVDEYLQEKDYDSALHTLAQARTEVAFLQLSKTKGMGLRIISREIEKLTEEITEAKKSDN